MCGIVGIAGALSVKEEMVFKQLLYMDYVRGKDSTGVVQVDSHLEPFWYKRALPVYDFMFLPTYNKMFEASNRMLLGHNRAATKGKVNTVNAHPFEHDNIIGVHNGTLRNQRHLKDHAKFDVDSDNLFYNIAKEGIAQTYSKLEGAAALVWWDTKTNRINFIKNEERPLFHVFSKDRKVLYWASEWGMLDWALARNGMEIDKDIYTFKNDYHYSMEIPKVIPQEGLGKFTVKELEAYKAPKHIPVTRNTYGERVGTYGVGDTIEFKVTGVDSSHIYGKSVNWGNYVVRMHTGGKQFKKIKRQFETSDIIMTAKITHFDRKVLNAPVFGVSSATGAVKSTLLKVKPKEKAELPARPKVTLVDAKIPYGSSTLSLREWRVQVKEGCASCQAEPKIAGASRIIWVDEGLFFCDKECEQIFEEQSSGNKHVN